MLAWEASVRVKSSDKAAGGSGYTDKRTLFILYLDDPCEHQCYYDEG